MSVADLGLVRMVEGRMEEVEDTDEGSCVEIDLILDEAVLKGIKLGCN